ncbi:MAG: hypothetical protein Aureis2KO_17940 [Aureisphaera sp.]
MSDRNFIFKIGPWVIYPDSLLLKKDDLEFRTQDKVMKVLLLLLEANGAVVTKNEFYQKVWPDSIVTENSLNKAIYELRKILNRGSDKNFIETVPKKGYRITFPVYKEEYSRKGIERRPRHKKTLVGVCFLLVVTLMGIFIFNTIETQEEKVASSLAPNGKLIAYYKKTDNTYMLLLEDIEEKEIKEIANDLMPETFVINWSPSSNRLIYNASKTDDPFYSINVVSLENVNTTYIKFAKNELEHTTKSVPKDLDSATIHVDHREIRRGDDRIHHIFLNKKDTIKVLFHNDLVESFSW